MTCRRSRSELTVGMGSSSSPWTPNPGLFSPPLAYLPTLPEPLQPLSEGACFMGAMCSAGYCSSENTAANSQIPYLVVQWLRICLPMQGTRVRSLVQGRSHIPWGQLCPCTAIMEAQLSRVHALQHKTNLQSRKWRKPSAAKNK